jgi:hypothetical protein
MPQFIKHVGQVNNTGRKCIVVFRELPGENNSCLVVETETLPQIYHDDLITAVESDSAQSETDFFNYAGRSTFHDGRNMLEGLHLSGWLRKLSTSEVTMLPTREVQIGLKELNEQIAEFNNAGRTTSGDISGTDAVAESKPAGVLDDAQLANQMRSQAAFFQKEAQRLLAEAEALNPNGAVTPVAEVKPKRKYTKKK